MIQLPDNTERKSDRTLTQSSAKICLRLSETAASIYYHFVVVRQVSESPYVLLPYLDLLLRPICEGKPRRKAEIIILSKLPLLSDRERIGLPDVGFSLHRRWLVSVLFSRHFLRAKCCHNPFHRFPPPPPLTSLP